MLRPCYIETQAAPRRAKKKKKVIRKEIEQILAKALRKNFSVDK